MILGTVTHSGRARDLEVEPRATLILKSPETLRRLFLDDCHNDRTASFFGDATTILQYLPPHRVNDTLLFHLSDTRPIGFNPVAHPTIATTLPKALDAAWPSTIPTTQLDRYLIPAAMALLEIGGTLFQLPYLYRSEQFRTRVLGKIKDPVIRKELEDFGDRKPEKQDDQTNSLQNRFTVLQTDKAIRRILSQKRTLKQPGIVIVDLPDHDRYDFVAALVLATLTGAAYIERPLFHLGESIPVIGCDYLGQLPKDLKDKILASGIIMATRLGPVDAKELAPHFDVDPGNIHLHELKDSTALVRTDRTHLVNVLPINYTARPSMERRVRNRSQSTYGTPANVVDERIERFIDGL